MFELQEMTKMTRMTFLHCIIHQESLYKSVLELDHVIKMMVNHHQLIHLLEESETEQIDLPHKCAVLLKGSLAEPAEGVSPCVGVERRNRDISCDCC